MEKVRHKLPNPNGYETVNTRTRYIHIQFNTLFFWLETLFIYLYLFNWAECDKTDYSYLCKLIKRKRKELSNISFFLFYFFSFFWWFNFTKATKNVFKPCNNCESAGNNEFGFYVGDLWLNDISCKQSEFQ